MTGSKGHGTPAGCALRVCLPLAAVGLFTGCSRQALPVQHVAIYRNGVAYIERSGHVGAGDVAFRMRQGQIDDFLATLAVTERTGRSVRTAAFPIGGGDDDKSKLQTVVLSLDGAAHDLQVGYITGAPVWKPSYRLVMGNGGDSDFQVWGLVQNLSGEDWKDVRLSLVAGAPIAFSSDLQNPVIPTRPTIVDRGESIGAVPDSEMTLGLEAKKAVRAEVYAVQRSQSSASGAPPAQPKSGVAPLSDSAALAPSLSGAASGVVPAAFGGSTRYDVSGLVTIPDETTTLVMVLSRRVHGEEGFLFSPNVGIPESASHPFRAVRFMNDTGGEIAPGPIAMFHEGVFLGQAMVDVVPAGASSTLPFALERSVEVDKETTNDSAAPSERVARISDGQLTIEHVRALQTVYRIRNGGEKPVKLMVKHVLSPQSKLYSPPPGTEHRPGTTTALVPTTVPAQDRAELVVEERSGEYHPADWFSQEAGHAVRSYLADPGSDRDTVQKLSAVWALREEVAAKMREREHLRQQSYDLQQETEEIRRNLKAAGGGTGDTLRAKLGTRLTQAMAQISDNDHKIVALDASTSSLSDRFKHAIEDVRTP
jgi:hypothetical protein